MHLSTHHILQVVDSTRHGGCPVILGEGPCQAILIAVLQVFPVSPRAHSGTDHYHEDDQKEGGILEI